MTFDVIVAVFWILVILAVLFFGLVAGDTKSK